MSSEWKEKEPEVAAIQAALDALGKHFQTVQIFCSRIDPAPEADDDIGATQRLIKGRGNFYARLGQVREWLITEEEKTRHEVRTGDKGGD